MKQKIVIVGLGLIGGSLAKAFRKYTDCSVAGHRPRRKRRGSGPRLRCRRQNRNGRRHPGSGYSLSVPVPAARVVEWTREHLASIRPGCLVTDTCGIKSWLCPRMEELAREGGFQFVGGHPMAGREKNGFSASDADLFQGASYLLVPCGAPQSAVETLKVLAPAARLRAHGGNDAGRARPDDRVYKPASACAGLRLCDEPAVPEARRLFGGKLPRRFPRGEHQRNDVDGAVPRKPGRADGGTGHAHRPHLRKSATPSRQATPKRSGTCCAGAGLSRKGWENTWN